MANPFRRESYQNPEPVPYNSIRPLTAAAARVNLKDSAEAEQFRQRQGSEITSIQAAAWSTTMLFLRLNTPSTL